MIGPTFGAELAAAGLGGLAFSWGSDGTFTYGPTITNDQRAAIASVLAAHDPNAAVPDTSLEDGMSRPEIQALLGLLAQQQNTTVDALQNQATSTVVRVPTPPIRQ